MGFIGIGGHGYIKLYNIKRRIYQSIYPTR